MQYFCTYLIFLLCCLCIPFTKNVFANNANYISISNQVSKINHLNIVSNNAANVNTVGFEEDGTRFKQYDQKTSSKKENINSFVRLEEVWQNKSVGPLQETGRILDIAVLGDGYLKIGTPSGFRYTLNGNMTINADRILVNSLGYPFLSIDNQQIEIPQETKNIVVATDGYVYADEDQIAQIGVVDFPPDALLLKQGSNLYSSNKNDFPATNYSVESGFLRQSNVNSVKVMSDMIELQRSVESTKGLIDSIDNTQQLLITKIIK